MYVIDYKHILVFNQAGFNVFRKLLNDDELTQSETARAWQMYRALTDTQDEDISGDPLTQISGDIFPIQDTQRVLCFGPVEYDIIVKMLRGDTDLSDEENRRADQMHHTLLAMEKARKERQGQQPNNYRRPIRRVQRPQHHARA